MSREWIDDPAIPQRILESDLANAEEWLEVHRRLWPGEPAERLEVAGAVAFGYASGLPLSRVIGAGFRQPLDEAALDAIEGFFARLRSSFVMQVPHGDPDLASRLARRGYGPGFELSVMARPIADADRPAPPPSFGEIVRVGPAEAGDWARVLAEGFDERSDPRPAYPRLRRIALEAPRVASFLARVDGVAAGGGSVGIDGPIAGLFGAATIPAHRRRGVQGALVRARLAHAAGLGCRLATVGAERGSDSERNLERHGFRRVASRLALRHS